MRHPKDQKSCATCEYFIQHYGWSEDRYNPINAGHCIFHPRMHNRQPGNPPCEHWAQQSEDYKQRHTPSWNLCPAPKPEKEYCIRVQIFAEK